ncbi:hypothetical protein [Falsibacillus pallidus]|nr:hypothetical protein [Falsibacillus pallidus]
MEETKYQQGNVEAKLDEILTRLDRLEKQGQRHAPKSSGVWVLVPVVAIIMWGLQNIF